MLFHWIHLETSRTFNVLQYQYTGYSINLAGGRITLLAMAFPFNLKDVTLLVTDALIIVLRITWS